MKRLANHVKGLTAILFASALAFSFAGTASALPVSDFSTSSAAVTVNQPVTLTFTGSCDLEPCRITWRWFAVGGSRLGTTIGEGPEVVYSFGAAGVYFVVAKITNAGSTHGSSSSTHVITVATPADPPVVEPPVVEPPVVDPPVVGTTVVDPPVVGTTVVDPPVVGTTVVDPPVVGTTVVDPPVVGTTVVDPPVVGTTVVDPPVVGTTVVDPPVVGTTVVDPPVVGTTVVDPPVVETTVVDPPMVTDPTSTPPVDDDSGHGHGGGPEDD